MASSAGQSRKGVSVTGSRQAAQFMGKSRPAAGGLSWLWLEQRKVVGQGGWALPFEAFSDSSQIPPHLPSHPLTLSTVASEGLNVSWGRGNFSGNGV